MKGDSKLSLSFLLRWAPDGPWCLSAVDPPRTKGMITQTFDLSSMKECEAFIDHWNGRRNLYFMVNKPRGQLSSKAKKEHVAALRALHVDLDPSDPPKGLESAALAVHYEAERNLILERLSAYNPEPSVIIFSGGGYGAFWLIEELEIENEADAERFELFNKKLEKDLKGDHCHNIDRIMRLPGTVNIPDPKKVAKGRVEAVSSIVHADWNRIYKLENFKPLEEEKKQRKKKKVKADDDEDWIERVLKNGPDHEGPRAYDGDRSKALWAVCLGMVRRNMTVEEITAAILDKSNKLSEHVYDQSDPKRYAARQANKAYDEAMGDFTFNEKGQPHPTQENVRVALKLLEVRISFDEFAQRAYIEGPNGLPKRKVDDAAFEMIYLMIAREFNFRPAVDLFKMMIRDEARANTYHPLKEYLNGLKWDGKPRIDTWLIEYAGVKDNDFTRAVSAIFFIAGVRRINSPGCKYDEIIVIEGEQGYNKSSALMALAKKPEWFTDSLPMNAKDKEVIEALEGKWIVEIAELKGMRASQVEHYKAMLSRQHDRARLSYGYFASEVPRQCVFTASTNSESYLADTTGNRRFWPFLITCPFDLDAMKRDVDQLWAEAVQREAAGESIRLNPNLYGIASLEQQRREIDDPWESTVAKCINGYEGGKILSADLWELVEVPVKDRTQKENERLGGIMIGLGWERKKTRFGGPTTEWGYAKGPDPKRIRIQRDTNGILRIERDGDLEGHVVEPWEE